VCIVLIDFDLPEIRLLLERVQWMIDPAAMQAAVPRFSIQPLVENSIKHAVAATTVPVTIEVGARVDDRSTVFWVADHKPNGKPVTVREGFGLSSLRNRLYFLYVPGNK
jgi:LytS/YehU family sensor histidine kinase